VRDKNNVTYPINITWDDEANVWVAISDEIPLALEDESYDSLIERIKIVAHEIIELNSSDPNKQTPNLLLNSQRMVAYG